MSKPIRITQVDAVSCGVVAYLYEKAVDANSSDLLVGSWPLSSLADVAEIAVTATRYVIIRDSTDDAAKSIDNW